jgi:predicted adenine nucleotide alpha hydrolase (AANH) superfamily ATPase
MLVHLCCAVDAGYFLKRLQEDFPAETIVGFFYDPNIQPYNEYLLRMRDTKRTCKKLGIEMIEGEYNYEYWLKRVSGYEDEPEKGVRCSICFDVSLEETAKVAKKLGHKKISTSLLMSPMKSHEQLANVGKMIKRVYDIDFIVKEYAKNGGHQKQQEMAKNNQVYRQDYCGCIFGLLPQRAKRGEYIPDELYSPITNQILPASIEERLKFYEKRDKLEEKGIKFKILKENFLNYRLLSGKVTIKKQVIPSYILFYSYLEQKNGGRIEFIENGIYHLNRMQIKFITLKKFNELLNKNYKNIYEIYKNPPTIKEEILVREKVLESKYNLSPLIILEKIPLDKRIDIEIEAKIYPDNKEILKLI